jgi:hypothetical protein
VSLRVVVLHMWTYLVFNQVAYYGHGPLYFFGLSHLIKVGESLFIHYSENIMY